MAALQRVIRILVDGSVARTGARTVQVALGDIGRSARRAKGETDDFSKSLTRGRASALGLAAGLFGLVAAYTALDVIRSVISDTASYELAQIELAKVTNISTSEVLKLSTELDNLARVLPGTQNELLKTATAAGRFGVRGRENILAFTEAITQLTAATQGSFGGDFAATTLARILNIAGEPATEITNTAGALALLGDELPATESEIARIATFVSQSAAAFGLASTDALALGGALAATGQRAETAGTAIGRIFSSLNQAVRQGGVQLELFVALTGKTREELDTLLNNDPVKALEAIAIGFKNLDASGGDVTRVLDLLGLTSVRAERVLVPLGQRAEILSRNLKLVEDRGLNTLKLFVESERNVQSLSGQTERFNDTLRQIRLDIGLLLRDEARELVRFFADVLSVLFQLPGANQEASASAIRAAQAIKFVADALLLVTVSGAGLVLLKIATSAGTLAKVLTTTLLPALFAVVKQLSVLAFSAGIILGSIALGNTLKRESTLVQDGSRRINKAIFSVIEVFKSLDELIPPVVTRVATRVIGVVLDVIDDVLKAIAEGVRVAENTINAATGALGATLRTLAVQNPNVPGLSALGDFFSETDVSLVSSGFDSLGTAFTEGTKGLRTVLDRTAIEARQDVNRVVDDIKEQIKLIDVDLDAVFDGIAPSSGFSETFQEEFDSLVVGITEGVLQVKNAITDIDTEGIGGLPETSKQLGELQRLTDELAASIEEFNETGSLDAFGNIQTNLSALNSLLTFTEEKGSASFDSIKRLVDSVNIDLATGLSNTPSIDATILGLLPDLAGASNTEIEKLISTLESGAPTFDDAFSGFDSLDEETLRKMGLSEELINRIRNALIQLEEQRAFKQLARDIGETFGDAIGDIIFEFESLEKAAEQLLRNISRILFDELVARQIAGFVSGLVTNAGSAFGFGGAAVPSRLGNVVSQGTIVPFQRGGIVSGPQLFPLSDGRTGLRGEAGPEAILPLARNNRGELAVKTTGEMGQRQTNVTVNQVIQTADPDSFRASRGLIARRTTSTLRRRS